MLLSDGFLVSHHFIISLMTNIQWARGYIILMALAFMALLTSCTEDTLDDMLFQDAMVYPVGYPSGVFSIIGEECLTSIEESGISVHAGTSPSRLEGTYLASPLVLTSFGSTPDTFEVGDTFASLRIHFYDYSPTSDRIFLDIRHMGISTDSIVGYVAGSGRQFTVFFNTSEYILHDGDSAFATCCHAISGQLSTNSDAPGIQAMEYFCRISDKSDPRNRLMEIGDHRVFQDEDGFVELVVATGGPGPFVPLNRSHRLAR